jgi:uncharacterized membrane protein YdjX (TVP38/TMEM64 family)
VFSTIAIALGFPGNVLAVTGGAMFGLLLGTLLSVVGGTLGAIGAFWLARYSLHDWANRTFGHHRLLKRLNHANHSTAAQSCAGGSIHPHLALQLG